MPAFWSNGNILKVIRLKNIVIGCFLFLILCQLKTDGFCADKAISVETKLKESILYGKHYDKLYALVVGIDNYQSKPLQYAVKDAKAIKQALTNLGFDKNNIICLYNEEATKENILNALTQELSKKLKRDDGLVIFFSGHGLTHQEEGKEVGYWVPSDGSFDSTSCISMILISEILNSMKCKHILLLIDCCYSGFVLQKSNSISSKTEGYVEAITQKKTRQIITAGGKNEQAMEVLGHGVFTEKLIDGLSGIADVDFDGVITATELAQYVKKRVSVHSSFKQTPLFGNLEGEGEFVFIRQDLTSVSRDGLEAFAVRNEEYEKCYISAVKSIQDSRWKEARTSLENALKYRPNDPIVIARL